MCRSAAAYLKHVQQLDNRDAGFMRIRSVKFMGLETHAMSSLTLGSLLFCARPLFLEVKLGASFGVLQMLENRLA